ncbi:MAG: hypothetical protein FJY92_05160 [Candidatus Hydrogenedentes bacterium]|nr:hypothetical protein [Candidatus Hydrogenedentota bacterium]
MNDAERAQRLHGLPLLRPLPDDARARAASVIARVAVETVFTDGEALIKQRALGGRDGYVLIDGQVAIEKETGGPIVVDAPALLGEMLQFNPRAQRTADVRARGAVIALKFAWQDFYAEAKRSLSDAEQGQLMEAIERSAWERFGGGAVLDLPLFDGLPESLKLRASLSMQWIVQHQVVADGERLFAQGDLCGATGLVIVHGAVRLVTTNFPPRVVEAPGLVGVMPRFEPGLLWSATAVAQGETHVLRFSWQEYMALIERRLSTAELKQFIQALDTNSPRHFIC